MAARSLTLFLLLLVACAQDGEVPAQRAPAEVPVPTAARLAELDADLVRAIREGAARLELEAGDVEAWLELGMTYEAHSMHEEAHPCYLEATRVAPDEPRAWLRLGLAEERAGELPGAVASFEQLIALAPDYLPARQRLGYLHLDAGDPARARAVFEEVLVRAADDPPSLQGLAQCDLDQGDPQAALDRLSREALLEGAHRALTQRLRGLALARLGRSAEAEAALAEGIAAKPSIQDPWSREVSQFKVGLSALFMRAQKLVDRGRVTAALKMIEPHRDAGDHRVLRLLGKAYGLESRFGEAAEVLAEAYTMESDDPKLALALAAAYSMQLRNSEATNVLTGFLDRLPQHVEPWRGLQELAFLTNAFDRAIDLRDEARAAGHHDPELEAIAGRAAMKLARHEVALASFDAALEAGPRTGELLLDRARARLELDDVSGAGDDIVEAALLGHPDVNEVRRLWKEKRGQ